MAEYTHKDVVTPRPKYSGGTWWHRIGSATVSEDGKITVYLDSYPLPDEKGIVKMMLFDKKTDEERAERSSERPAARKAEPRRAAPSRADDDEIPF